MSTDRVLCVGGAFSEYAMLEMDGSGGGQWVDRAELPEARDGSEAVAAGGFLYVISGEGERAVGSMDRFNAVTGEWSRVGAQLPRAVRQSAAVLLESRLLLLIGGEDVEAGAASSGLLAVDVDCLNESWPACAASASGGAAGAERARSVWSALPQCLGSGRRGHAAVVYHDRLWVAGGVVRDVELTNSVETVDLDALLDGEWQLRESCRFEPAAPMINRRRNFKLVVLGDNLYAVGGDLE